MKRYADSTLRSMKKEDLIEYIRCLEHNCAAADATLDQQAKIFEKLFQERGTGGKGCEWCDIEYTIMDDVMEQPVHRGEIRFCFHCGRPLKGAAK